MVSRFYFYIHNRILKVKYKKLDMDFNIWIIAEIYRIINL